MSKQTGRLRSLASLIRIALSSGPNLWGALRLYGYGLGIREGIEDEREADDTPPTLEQQELKTLVRGDCGARLPEVFI